MRQDVNTLANCMQRLGVAAKWVPRPSTRKGPRTNGRIIRSSVVTFRPRAEDTRSPTETTIELTTTRCVLRPISPGDADPLHELWTSPGVRRFLWDDEVIPMARTVGAVEQSQRLFREHGFGLWGMWRQDPPTLSGFCGLWPFRDPPEMELVYGVAEPLWGSGYAAEVARAVIAFCFTSLDMPAVKASTDWANTSSIRVMEKLGFRFVRRSTSDGLDTVFYELPRAESPDLLTS